MMPSHEKKMIMMIKLPWRGRAETFPHTTEAEPKLSFFKIRDFQCDCNRRHHDHLDLRRAAVIVSGAVIVSIASVLKQRSSIQRCILTSSSSWHQRHPDIIIIQTSASSWHHHHPDISVIQASSSSRHQRHPDIIIILTSSSSWHHHHPDIIIIQTSASSSSWLYYQQTQLSF